MFKYAVEAFGFRRCYILLVLQRLSSRKCEKAKKNIIQWPYLLVELLADLIYCANLNVAAFLANGLFGVLNNNLTLMLKNMKCWKMLSTTV